MKIFLTYSPLEKAHPGYVEPYFKWEEELKRQEEAKKEKAKKNPPKKKETSKKEVKEESVRKEEPKVIIPP